MADILNLQMRPAQALAAVEKAMRLDPRAGNPREVIQQGFAYSLLGRWKEAIPAYQGYLVRYPDNLWVHAGQGDNYAFVGDDNGAQAEVAEVTRIINLEPNSVVGYLLLAHMLDNQGKPTEALAAIEQGMRVDPSSAYSSLGSRGFAYTLLGR